MARGKGFFAKLFNRNIEEDDFFIEYAIDGDEDEIAVNWDWDSLIKDRHLLKLSDDVQRQKFIRSLVEQVRDASAELDKLSAEYNAVTAVLKDADEIEALPKSESEQLKDVADRIIKLESESHKSHHAKKLMTEGQFQAMQRFSGNMPKVYEEIKQAEEQKKLIREDLKRLEDEKQGYLLRNSDLKREIVNTKSMLVISLFAAVVCVVMLLILQYGFGMDTTVGFILVAAGIAVAVSAIYFKYLEAVKDQKKAYQSINRIILLQNTVKIRYVNNKNLLDYLYMKYNISSAQELKKMINAYEDECERRAQNEANEKELNLVKQEYRRRLSHYRLNDVEAWIRNPLAVIDHKELVELRHAYILNRQKLRAQMEYNKRLAKEGEKELRQLIEEYPRYKKEVVDMLNKYE